MEEEKKGALEFDTHVVSEVPQSERQSWVSVMFVWMAGLVSVPAVLTGQQLANGMPMILAIVGGILGYLLILLITVFQGAESSDLGRPAIVAAKPAFGTGIANVLFSFVIVIALLGWFGTQTEVAGQSLKGLLELVGFNMPLPLAIIIMGVLMFMCAIIGFKVLEQVGKIVVPLLLIVFLWATFNVISTADFSTLLAYKPIAPISFIDGIVIVIGSMVTGAVIAGDYTRFNKNRKDTVKSAAFGVVPAGVLLIVIGILLTTNALTKGDVTPGEIDIVSIVSSNLPFPIIAYITILLATWKTNIINAYSGGIALVNGLKLKDSARPIATAVIGIIGIILALMGILNHLTFFLRLLTNLIIPIAGVMIADYWIINKGKKEGYMEKVPTKNIGVISYALGAILGMLNVIRPEFIAQYPTILNLLPILSIIVPLCVYVILKKMSTKGELKNEN